MLIQHGHEDEINNLGVKVNNKVAKQSQEEFNQISNVISTSRLQVYFQAKCIIKQIIDTWDYKFGKFKLVYRSGQEGEARVSRNSDKKVAASMRRRFDSIQSSFAG